MRISALFFTAVLALTACDDPDAPFDAAAAAAVADADADDADADADAPPSVVNKDGLLDEFSPIPDVQGKMALDCAAYWAGDVQGCQSCSKTLGQNSSLCH